MKKKFISAAAAGMIFFTCLPQAFADTLTVDTLAVNPDTRIVTVAGSVAGADYLQKVTLRVTNDKDGSLDYIAQATIGNDGTYRLEYRMTGEPGDYTVHVNTNDAEQDFTGALFLPDTEMISAIIDEINKKTTGSELYNYILNDEIQKNLDINISELEKIGPVEGACDLIIKEDVTFENVSEFVLMLNSKIIISGINAAEDANKVKELIGAYNSELGLDSLKRYEAYLADEKLAGGVNERIAGMSFNNEEEIRKAFEEQTVLEMIEQVSGSGEVYDILNDNNDILDLDFSVYNGLDSKSPVQKAIAGENFKTVKDLQETFDEACDKQKNKEDDKNSGGGGGGGSRPSSGGNKGGDTSGIVIRDNTQENQTVPDDGSEDETDLEQKHYFNDLENYAWAEEGINFLYEKGIIAGDGTGAFRPADSVKREEFIKMLSEMFGFEKGTAEKSFSDVTNGAWYADYVYAAVNEGVVSGFPDGSFGVGTDITRQDISVILSRTLEKYGKELPEKNEAKAFTDEDDISDYAKDSVKYMQTAGILNGFEGGTFAPKNSATRAEAARILYLIYNGIN